MIREFKIKNFDQIIGENKPVVLKFTAEWCRGCKQLAPLVENVSKENQDVIFYDVDIDEFLEFAQQKFSVMSIPTLVLLHNGKEVDRVTAPEPSEKAIIDFAHQKSN